MIVRPQQHWLRRIFVWHGSVLSKISSRLLLNFLFSIAVIFMLPWYTHLGIKFTLAPFSILGVAIAIFLGFRNNAGYARYVEARKLWGQLMIASRSLLREVKTTLPDSASVREFARLQIAFAHCLRMTLRKQPQAEVLAHYLKTEDLQRVLVTWMNNQRVGELTKLANGAHTFKYAPEWLASRYARPLSLSLPLQRGNITSDAVFNFFDNLLPDSPIVRDRIVKRYHAKSRQPFDLLSEIGRDSVGAVTLIPEDETVTCPIMAWEKLTEARLEEVMAFLMGSSEALKDRYDFMKFQVFQWLIGATDGHAKNFSVFIQAGGSYRLTPFYDIISAFPVLGGTGIHGTGIHISDLKLAMGLNASKGKKTAIDKIYPRHFLATAKVLKFPEVQMHEILSDFARMIPAALDNVKTSLPTDFPENVVTAVETNVLRLHGRLSREYGIK